MNSCFCHAPLRVGSFVCLFVYARMVSSLKSYPHTHTDTHRHPHHTPTHTHHTHTNTEARRVNAGFIKFAAFAVPAPAPKRGVGCRRGRKKRGKTKRSKMRNTSSRKCRARGECAGICAKH